MKGLYKMDAAERIAIFSIPEPNSGCWLWLGSVHGNGYGVLKLRGHAHLAHRLSYETHVGPIPQGLDLDHLCRVRCCVNPRHLEPVSRRVNVSRGLVSTRHDWSNGKSSITHCPRGHEYNAENTRIDKLNRRLCKSCHRDRERAKYQKKRSSAA